MTAADLIKHWEGCRLTAYRDVGGIWTVGWGCTGKINGVPISADTTLSQDEADKELETRIAYTQHVMSAMLDREPAPNQLAAMTSLAYNIGLTAFEHSTVRHAFNQKDPQGAADAFLLWNKVKHNVVPGLVNRRYAERRVFLGGEAHE